MSASTAFIEFGAVIDDVVSGNSTNADHRIREARAKLYRQTPNSNMKATPLTKIVLSNTGPPVKNPKFEWGMESHDDRYVVATAAHKGSWEAVGNEVITAGTTIRFLMLPVAVRQFVIHEEVEFRVLHSTDSTAGHQASVNAYVTGKTVGTDATDSYVTVKLAEDDTGKALYYVSQSDFTAYVSPISTAMPEGSQLPWHRYREATEHHNFCQIFMAGLGLTGTELSNAQRFDENTYERYWRQVKHCFDTYIERAILWGSRLEGTADVDMGAGTQTVKQYRTGGLRWMLKEPTMGNGRNLINVRTMTSFSDYDFTGKTWEEAGYDFLKLLLLEKSKKSGMRKQLYLSSAAKLSIMNLFESMTNVMVEPFTKDKWGFEITKIHGLNCDLELVQHQDLSLNPAWERIGFLLEPEKIQWRTKAGRDLTVIRSLKDLKAKTSVEDGFNWRDATKEGMFMDGGLMVDDLDGMAMITNLGCDFGT